VSPVTNAEIRLECLQTVQPSGGTMISVGSFCDPASTTCSMGFAPNGPPHVLACDSAERVCRLQCTSDANCTAGGLLGDVCDDRSWEEAVGALGVPDGAERTRLLMAIPPGTDITSPHNFCVNPTCIVLRETAM
jgi:hypothetical protein